MDLKDARTVRDLIHEIYVIDLIIISLILVPILFAPWLITLNSLAVENSLKTTAFIVFILFYIIGILIMKLVDPPEEKQRRAVRHIIVRLNKMDGNRASFNRIRSTVNKEYDDAFLRKLIDINPGVLGTVSIRSAGSHVEGITLVKEDLGDSEQKVAST
ncbi:MAG: hypothetical protein M1281_04530 [Chloroflexi bacterium]|nr:hypothetical protein [Chloroflexota bacterium]